jgi:hypothetical protein
MEKEDNYESDDNFEEFEEVDIMEENYQAMPKENYVL